MTAPADESMDWLAALEKRVSAVTAELADLRKKNRSLVNKVSRLERKARDRAAVADSGWAAEKAEVRERVAGLQETLEGLLEE